MAPYLIFPKITVHFHSENLQRNKPFQNGHNFCNWLADAVCLHTDGQVFWEQKHQTRKQKTTESSYLLNEREKQQQ